MKRKIYFCLPTFVVALLMLSITSCGDDEENNPEVINNNRVDAVDLGLPSGTLWATCNIGASKPEEFGDYFAWGETVGFNNGKKEFGMIDGKGNAIYRWLNISWEDKTPILTLTKYNTDGSKGAIDNIIELALEDDAAFVNWGDGWRMPSYEQFRELLNNCNVEWITFNGVNGRKITSTKNGNSIFLPAAGKREGKLHVDGGSHGYYWTRTLNDKSPSAAYDMNFSYNNQRTPHSNLREDGQSVRPVRQK